MFKVKIAEIHALTFLSYYFLAGQSFYVLLGAK